MQGAGRTHVQGAGAGSGVPSPCQYGFSLCWKPMYTLAALFREYWYMVACSKAVPINHEAAVLSMSAPRPTAMFCVGAVPSMP